MSRRDVGRETGTEGGKRESGRRRDGVRNWEETRKEKSGRRDGVRNLEGRVKSGI